MEKGRNGNNLGAKWEGANWEGAKWEDTHLKRQYFGWIVRFPKSAAVFVM